MSKVKIRFLSTNAILKALGTGGQTYSVLERLRSQIDGRVGEHLLLAQLRRRLKRMELDGLVRQRTGWVVTNSLFWEPVDGLTTDS